MWDLATIVLFSSLAKSTRVPVAAEVKQAVDAALAERFASGMPIRFDVLDYSRFPVPNGHIRLQSASALKGEGEWLWRGVIASSESAATGSFWVKVRVVGTQQVWVAASEILPGKPLDRDLLKIEARPVSLSARRTLVADEALEGRTIRRRLAPGMVIYRDDLAPAILVRRGAIVRVNADRGGAHIEIEAVADADAAAGERVALRNPLNGRRFFARVLASGHARAEGDGSSGIGHVRSPQ